MELMEAYNAPPRGTGRENRTTLYCERCPWESQIEGVVIGSVTECLRCQHKPIHFVHWEAGVEDEAARQAIAETRAAPIGPRGPGP